MNDELIELCPICIESPIQYYTECNHGYCIGCLCRIKKCAICRNPLQRAKICIQIKQKVKLIINPDTNPLIFNNSEDFDRRVTTTMSRNGDLQTRLYLQVNLPEISERFSQRESSYFSLNPENHQPSGIANFSRIDNTGRLPIDSIYYNNDGYIYDESGRRLNEPQQISSTIPRWGWSSDLQMRRGMLTYNHSPNRIPRWGYSRN